MSRPQQSAMPDLGPSALVVLFLAACAACTAPAEPSAEAGAVEAGTKPAVRSASSAPRPWTESFMEPAVLVAREVSIEGPVGLLEHLALQVDPDVHEYVVKTTSAGFKQDLAFKRPASGQVLRAQLDQLVIAAELGIHVLERPGDDPVVVTAVGNAVWTSTAGAERRGERLRLSGAEPR